jgi:hypothetical protein
MSDLKADVQKDFEVIDKLITAIQEKHPSHSKPTFVGSYEGKEDVKGTIECPVCENPVDYSIAGSNDHIEGHCSNKDCFVNFMM